MSERARECLEIFIEYWVFLDIPWSEFYRYFCKEDEDEDEDREGD